MITAIVFLYGLMVGSFLNVCAWRIPNKQSIVSPGSHCPKCDKPIKAYDNIPVLSYLLLKGHCRYCGEHISARYPVVEFITGLLFVVTYLFIGFEWLLFPSLVFVSLLWVIFLIDMDHQIIPDGLVIFGLVSGFIFLGASYFLGGFPLIQTNLNPLLSSVGSGLAASAFLLGITFVAELILKKEAMGGGDIKLAAVLGMFLGPYVFLALFLAFFVGAVISIAMMSTGLVEKGKPIAFGPFMAIGAILTLYTGPQIVNWYMSLMP